MSTQNPAASSVEEKPIFVPLLHNGNGDVKANFMYCHGEAFMGRRVCMSVAGDSHANRGMNKIACAFLKSGCDVWINIDADITFTRRDIDHLLSHDVPLVYGIYPKKDDNTEPCLCTFGDIPVPDERNLATVRRSGRGFMMVRRELLEKMKEDNGGPALRYHNHGEIQWDFFPSGPVAGDLSALGDGKDEDGYPLREWISEDWFFCERARALGVPTLVDARIALGHEGGKIFRFGASQIERTDGWHGVPGWFTDEDAETYRRIAKEIPNGGIFVEVGSWMGRSMCAMARFLREVNKSLDLHAVDTFRGTLSEGQAHSKIVEAYGGSIRSAFEANLLKSGVEATVWEMDSVEAAKRFDDGAINAVFIDGDHAYKAVRADVLAWLPKVGRGGIIAGHDYDYPDVRNAVHEFIPADKIEAIGRCWFYKMP